MSRYWSPVIHSLKPYVPGEQPQIERLVKLNTNENPYGPSPRVIEAIRAATTDSLRLYPDPKASVLRETIASLHNLTPEQVFVGNGSDEVLAHAFLGLLKHEAPLLFADITYSFYPVYCGLYQVHYEPVPLRDDFTIAPGDYLRPNGGILIANPNAPTGIALPPESIERIIAANPDSVVVIDEAYIDFGGVSAVGLIADHPNLLIVQTLSKSRSLAGLRVGFAMGQRELIEALERVKDSFNSYPLDRLAIAGAVAAFEDQAYFDEARGKIIRTRERLAKDLQELGFHVLPSQANFIFARHPERDGAELSLQLRERSILVRHFKLPRIDQFLRISIGTDDQCGKLVGALKVILQD